MIEKEKVTGLLDSGAQSSVAGGDFRERMQRLNILPNNTISLIRTADGTTHPVKYSYDVRLTFQDKTKILRILFVPKLKQGLILGMDFWTKFCIKPLIVGEILGRSL